MAKRDNIGKLTGLSKRLNSIAQKGPAAFERFLSSDEFRQRFNALSPEHRLKAIQAVVNAEADAKRRDRLPPVVQPTPGRGGKAKWSDPAMQQALREALAWAKGDVAKAARKLGVTFGAANLAKRRYLDAATVNARAAA
jgi:hypothetical protein